MRRLRSPRFFPVSYVTATANCRARNPDGWQEKSSSADEFQPPGRSYL